MILVTGASGHLGQEVIRQLITLYPATKIVGLARDISKMDDVMSLGVQVRIGDYNDIDSLNRAMTGIEKVLLISGTNEDNRVTQHLNVINAAKKNGVKFISYTSRLVKNQDTSSNHLMEGHFKTEALIIESGLQYVIFRNALYFDTIPTFVGGNRVFLSGNISVPAGDGKVSFVLRSELGEAIAKVLVNGNFNDEIISLTADKSWSLYDVARSLTDVSGKPVNYTPIERTEFLATLISHGLPELLANRYADFQMEINNGVLDEITNTLESILARKPAQLKEGILAVFDVTHAQPIKNV
jgi:NAD(P)H dehydrogenase (quinone)